MENPNSTSQDVPKFLSICPISMAQFQEKFIFLGKKKKTSAHVSVRTHYSGKWSKMRGKPEREEPIIPQPSRKNPGLDCSWTVAHSAHASHCGKGITLCFKQPGPTPEAKLSVVTVPWCGWKGDQGVNNKAIKNHSTDQENVYLL